MPGINEVWSLVSGTRSNPPHGPAHAGAHRAENGGHAGSGAAAPGHAAPYTAGEGTSEGAEYSYEGQYDQQQYRSTGYDGSYDPSYPEYEASGAHYAYAAADYEAFEAVGATSGEYDAARYQQGEFPQTAYQEYARQEYSEQEYAAYGGEQYPPQSEYRAEYAEYSEHSQPSGSQAQQQAYTQDVYSEYGDYSGGFGDYAQEGYGSPAMAGVATATATAIDTELLDEGLLNQSLLDEDLEVPESPQGLSGITTLPDRASLAPRPEAEPAAQPESRRSGGRKQILRTRPRTGPLGRVVQGIVLAALVGGAITYVAYDKTITLSIDGQSQTVHTFAGTVGAVLSADGVDTGSKDIVTPSPAASTASGQTITVRYGRPLDLTVNGVTRKTWVHYATVGGALQELGVRTAGARTSDPLNAAIPRSGMNGLVVYTMRHITFLVDGKTVPLETTAPTVTAAISQAGIVLHNQDAPSVAANSVPTDGETISINRITGSTETKEVSIPFDTTKVDDPNSYTGTSTVKTQGVDGEETVTYALLTINGVAQKPKQISETVTKQPVNEVLAVGTKALPTSASSLNWAALANCESGGNPAEDTGNGFYGMYQFSEGTWQSLGGTGYPNQASAATQTALAEQLYERSGAGQWPVCGHLLFS